MSVRTFRRACLVVFLLFVEAIKKEFDKTNKIFNFLNREVWTQGLAAAYHSLLQLYPYDLTNPDVMIFSTKFPPGYPNGRLLTDDGGLGRLITIILIVLFARGEGWGEGLHRCRPPPLAHFSAPA